MEKSVLQSFDESILREASGRFGIEPDNLRLVSDMENLVYDTGTDELPYILRITHSSHRTRDAILGELEWMEYLHSHGVSVPQPVYSLNRTMIEVIDANPAYFLVTVFEKIPGKTILDANECLPETYEQWGQILGRMHALAKDFQPSQPSYKRADWDEDDLICNAEKYIPAQTIVLDKLHQLVRDLYTLPKGRNSYGLIHADFTDVNFFIHNHQITVFDFDDCLYHWFVYDIATILHDSPWLPHGEMNNEENAHYFWGYFVKGYQRENALDPFWINQLVKFIKLRDINLYVVYHKKWDFNNLSEGRQRFLKKTKQNIENDIPSLALNLLLVT